jgi:hypothetical protein
MVEEATRLQMVGNPKDMSLRDRSASKDWGHQTEIRTHRGHQSGEGPLHMATCILCLETP